MTPAVTSLNPAVTSVGLLSPPFLTTSVHMSLQPRPSASWLPRLFSSVLAASFRWKVPSSWWEVGGWLGSSQFAKKKQKEKNNHDPLSLLLPSCPASHSLSLSLTPFLSPSIPNPSLPFLLLPSFLPSLD